MNSIGKVASVALGLLFLSILQPSLSDRSSSSSENLLDQPFQESFKHLDHVPCVTLFHRNGRVGCSTQDRDVQVGRLVYYGDNDNNNNNNDNNDNNNNNNNGFNYNADQPHVAVIDEYDFTAANIQNILKANNNGNNNNQQLQGILVINSTNVDYYHNEKSYYSPASQSPNGYGTPAEKLWYSNANYPWNAKGQDIADMDLYGVPIAYVPDSDVADTLRQYAQNQDNNNENNNKPQNFNADIVAEFNYYMGADGITSQDCLAWKDSSDNQWNPKCLPLGGTSIWATAGTPDYKQNQNQRQRRAQEQETEKGAEQGQTQEQPEKRKLANNNNYNNRKIIMMATSIDSTSLFHDMVPGVNTAASNILALLMAAKLIGQLSDYQLDQLPKQILFGFFQSESYGFVGSRSFLNDILNFQCDEDMTVQSIANDANSPKACLYPLRPSLDFKSLNNIAGMIAVDQVGVPVADGTFYTHYDGNQNGIGYFLSKVMKYSYTNDYVVSYASVENNNGGVALPPTPLTSLMSLTQGQYGGAVLTGYDYAFSNQVPYQSHLESEQFRNMNLDAIASAATLLARTALAAAYDDGSGDYETAAQYAAKKIDELDPGDEMFNELANCFFKDGNCDLLKQYHDVETKNEQTKTGIQIGDGYPLGTPPNYYTNVYNGQYGQPFVRVNDLYYGAYDGKKYGKHNSDAFSIMPRLHERAIRGMLDDFLGRGSGGNNNDGNNNLVQCNKLSDCNKIDYCQQDGDQATCTGGGYCVCSRSNYHMALDEALVAAPNMGTGYFQVSENDNGYSAIYTEPYWSSNVGVKIYRKVNQLPGIITLITGIIVSGLCGFASFVVLVGLKKQKMY